MNTSELFDQWLDLLDDCCTVSKHLNDGRIHTRYSNSSKAHLLLLLNNAIRHSRCIVAMGRAGQYSGIPVLARSILESHADYKLLVENDEQLLFMTYASYKQQLKLLNSRLDAPDDDETKDFVQRLEEEGMTLAGVVESTTARMEDCASLLSKKYINKKGEVLDSFHRRFERAGLVKEFRTIYNLLSTHTHANVSAIAGGATKSGSFQWPPDSEPVPLMAVVLAVDLLIKQSLAMANLYRLVNPEPLLQLELRRRVLPEG